MAKFLQKIFLPFYLVTSFTTYAQVKFSTIISSPQIYKNEILQVKLMLDNATDVESITPPEFKNFIIVSGPNQESGMTVINSAVKQYVSINYMLKPKSAGKFIIQSASAKVQGKIYKSNTARVEVMNAQGNSNSNSGSGINSLLGSASMYDELKPENPFKDNIIKKGENVNEKISKNMFVKLQLDKTNCFVGEPITATYKLYTRLKSESNLVKSPSFNGFSVIDLEQPDNYNYTRETINGKEYNVYLIRKAQLYPLQSGVLELEPAEIENKISFIKAEYANRQNELMNDMFRDFAEANIPPEGIESQTVTLQNKPALINVKPLPTFNMPENFNGAVGKFGIVAEIEKNTFATDNVGKIKILIGGSGNLQLINSPELKWPSGFEGYEPTTEDEFIKTTVPISGRKVINYTFTINEPGNYIFPSVKFSYFNPKEGKFYTDSTSPISFTVVKGTNKKILNTTIANSQEKKSFFEIIFSNRLSVIGLVVFFILVGLIFWVKKDKKKEIKNVLLEKKIEANKALEKLANETTALENINWLEKTVKVLYENDSSKFYNELNLGLKNYLAQKLNLPIETINKKSIGEKLEKINISTSVSKQLYKVMNDIELQLYAPLAKNEEREELFNSTAAIIQLLDTYKD